jgi:hypothetical protein
LGHHEERDNGGTGLSGLTIEAKNFSLSSADACGAVPKITLGDPVMYDMACDLAKFCGHHDAAPNASSTADSSGGSKRGKM